MDALQISFLLDAEVRTRLQQKSCENKLSCPERQTEAVFV